MKIVNCNKEGAVKKAYNFLTLISLGVLSVGWVKKDDTYILYALCLVVFGGIALLAKAI